PRSRIKSPPSTPRRRFTCSARICRPWRRPRRRRRNTSCLPPTRTTCFSSISSGGLTRRIWTSFTTRRPRQKNLEVMKRNPLTIIISAVLAVIFVLVLFVFQVRKSEIAVVTRFGATSREQSEPGPYFRLPWPIENVYKLDQRIQNFEDKLTEPQTADNNLLVINVYVGWRITDAKTFFPRFAGGSILAAERTLEDIVSQAKSAVVGKHVLGDFANADEKQLKFDAIEGEIKALAQ